MAYNFQYQAKTQPTLVIIASMATWFMPLAEPVRDQAYEVSSNVSTFLVPVAAPAADVSVSSWNQPLSEPVRLKSGVAVQQSNQSQTVFIITPPVVDTTIGWYQPLGDPLKDQPFEVSSDISSFIVPVEPPPTDIKWNYPWSEPVRQKIGLAARYQQAAWLVKAAPFPETVTEDRWHQPWSEPTRRKAILQLNQPYTPRVSVAVTEDQFHQPWSEPIRRKTQIPIAQSYSPYLVTTIDRYHQPWSTPTRSKPSIHQQAIAWGVLTPPVVTAVTPIDWAQELYQPRPESFDVVSTTAVFVAIAATTPTDPGDLKWQTRWPDRIPVKRFLTSEHQVTTHIPVKTLYPFGIVSQGPVFTQVTPYQSIAFPTPIVAPAAPVTPIDWSQELYQPRPEGYEVVSTTATFVVPFTPEVITVDKWFRPLAEPPKPKAGLRTAVQQSLAWGIAAPPPVVVTPIDWAQEIYQPRPESFDVVNINSVFLATPNAPTPDPGDIKWQSRWPDKVDAKRFLTANHQVTTHIPVKVFVPFGVVSQGPVFTQITSYQSIAWPVPVAAAEIITVDKWFRPFSEPTRRRTLAHYQPLPQTPFQPPVLESSWHQPWSLPVRLKPGLRSNLQQALAMQPRLPVIFEGSWHYPWSEPVRQKPGLKAGLQQTLAWPPLVIANPPAEASWHFAWSEPVRHQAYEVVSDIAVFTAIATIVPANSWNYAWSEPVRQKLGLKPGLQQVLTWPPQIIANPVFVTMNARETNGDIFEGAIVLNASAARSLVSIREITRDDGNAFDSEDFDFDDFQ